MIRPSLWLNHGNWGKSHNGYLRRYSDVVSVFGSAAASLWNERVIATSLTDSSCSIAERTFSFFPEASVAVSRSTSKVMTRASFVGVARSQPTCDQDRRLKGDHRGLEFRFGASTHGKPDNQQSNAELIGVTTTK